ncbi:hypothetical protein [Azorhizobium caulinodans]|uniref:hypothetical protein n=1 Tax=Azorhizobium caulinodans TaxID=7 RepID=UPI002FBEEB0E
MTIQRGTEDRAIDLMYLGRIRFSSSVSALSDSDFSRHVVRSAGHLGKPAQTSAAKGAEGRAQFVFDALFGEPSLPLETYRAALSALGAGLGYVRLDDFAALFAAIFPEPDALLAHREGICRAIAENGALGLGADVDTDLLRLKRAAFPWIFAGPTRSRVEALFNILLRRPPQADELDRLEDAVRAGDLDAAGVVHLLVTSDEFGPQAIAGAAVARHVAGTVLETLMKRDVGEVAVSAYSQSIQNGYPLSGFLEELINSPEFRGRIGALGSAAPAVQQDNLAPLTRLAEGLLVEHLAERGCAFPAAPPLGVESSSPEQLRSLLFTLAMLAKSQASGEKSVH